MTTHPSALENAPAAGAFLTDDEYLEAGEDSQNLLATTRDEKETGLSLKRCVPNSIAGVVCLVGFGLLATAAIVTGILCSSGMCSSSNNTGTPEPINSLRPSPSPTTFPPSIERTFAPSLLTSLEQSLPARPSRGNATGNIFQHDSADHTTFPSMINDSDNSTSWNNTTEAPSLTPIIEYGGMANVSRGPTDQATPLPATHQPTGGSDGRATQQPTEHPTPLLTTVNQPIALPPLPTTNAPTEAATGDPTQSLPTEQATHLPTTNNPTSEARGDSIQPLPAEQATHLPTTSNPTSASNIQPTAPPTAPLSTPLSITGQPTTIAPIIDTVMLFGNSYSISTTTSIVLKRKKLTGSISTELGLLTAMTRLEVQNNELIGQIPTELGLLTQMTLLRLQDNQLTGRIPTELGLLTGLKGLSLALNDLSGPIPTELGSMVEMTWTHLYNNQLTGAIPAELGTMVALKVLWIFYNQLTGTVPESLCSLSQLDIHREETEVVCPAECGLNCQ